jgi:type II secretory pathway pseudopilin PulG
LIETVAAASLLVFALLAAAASITRAKLARVTADQETAALSALEQASDTLRARGVTLSWQQFGGGGTMVCAAPGLADGDDPKLPARVIVDFLTDETATVPEFGLPGDLDGDGVAATANTAQLGADGQLLATVLPYVLTLRMRGPDGGARTLLWNGILSRAR